MPRIVTPEMMDDPSVDEQELERSLSYIRAVNKHLGGRNALLHHLKRWSSTWPTGETITLLDIATGSADLPVACVRWARSEGIDLRVTAIDTHEKTLACARRFVERFPDLKDSIEIVRADAFTLLDRFGPESYDYVHAGLFLHHLSDIQVQTMLRIMERLARRGVIWNDLIRSTFARLGIRLLTIGRPEIIRHDARVSVSAGFTRTEALELASKAWEHEPRYRSNLLSQRFTVVCEKGTGHRVALAQSA